MIDQTRKFNVYRAKYTSIPIVLLVFTGMISVYPSVSQPIQPLIEVTLQFKTHVFFITKEKEKDECVHRPIINSTGRSKMNSPTSGE
jgi:hypothetical protein